MNNYMSKVYSDRVEDLRSWLKDVEEFFDTVNSGMQKFMAEIDKQTVDTCDLWVVEQESEFGSQIIGDATAVWRALKKLTDGEARKVV